jgi:hypothetical protein
MEDYESLNFKNINECCYLKDDFIKCSRNSVKNSFFCGKHKPLLFKLNEFRLNHAGNVKKIVDTMTIKSAKDAKFKGSGVHNDGTPYSQVFITVFFPNFRNTSYGFPHNKAREIKEHEKGELFLKPTILDALSNKRINIDFTDHLAMGDCIERLCIQYNKDFSTRENLNRFYHFLTLCQYKHFLSDWKLTKKSKSFEDIKKEIFNNVSNEMRIYDSVPLVIDGKNYIEDYILY